MAFQIVSQCSKTSKKYKVSRKSITFKLNDIPDTVQDPEVYIKSGIHNILKHILRDTATNDKIGFTFSSGLFSKGDVHLSLRKAADIRFDNVWELLSKLYQSNAEGFSSDTFTLTATIARGSNDVTNKPRPSNSQV